MNAAAIDQFREALRARNIIPPAKLLADGELHRCDAEGKNGKGDAAYVLHLDGVPAGGLENHRDGQGWENWTARVGRKLSPVEAAAQQERMAAAKKKRDAEELTRHGKVAANASALWEAAAPASADHPYLRRKGVEPHGARVYHGDLVIGGVECNGALMIRMRDLAGVTRSIQFIAPNGEKRFLPGGRTRGLYYGLEGTIDRGILIAEGFATAASLFEATGRSTLAAFDAANVELVAETLRETYPALRITICADDDVDRPGNPGRTKAIAAALAVGAMLALPDFSEDRPAGATDFNDLARHRGAEAVRRAVANARAPGVVEPPTQAAGAARVEVDGPVIKLVRADAITPEPIRWIWDGFLAGGKLHILAGAPATGKTTLALAIAATISTGGRWPDGTRASVGDLLIWSGEDSAGDTLVPRLIAAEADLSRIHIVRDVRDGSDQRPFDPAVDFPDLTLAATRIAGLRLMIVDPIVSAVAGDSHKNSETRRALQPLVDFAERSGCALLGVSHFSKGTQGHDPVERVTGSLAFGAVARVVLGTAKLRDDEGGGRALVRAKSNIGPDGGGFRYELRQDTLAGDAAGIVASRVEWSGTLTGTARAILAAAEADIDQEDRTERADAANWLLETLKEAGGEMPMRQAIKAGALAGYKERTLQRARVTAGVAAIVTGFGKEKRSLWRLGEAASMPQIMPIVPTTDGGMNGTNGGMDGPRTQEPEEF